MSNWIANFITDLDILKRPFNMTRRLYRWSTFPWLAVLPDIEGTGGVKYSTLQSTSGYAGTTLTAACTGGGISETLEVADSSIFKVADGAVLCTDNTNKAQMVYVTAVPDPTHITVASVDGVTAITAKAKGTTLSLAGNHESYEEYHRGVGRLPTMDYNIYEKIQKRLEFPVNVRHSTLEDGTPVYEDQVAEVTCQWKQAATHASIIGQMVDPTASATPATAVGKMAGLDQILSKLGGNNYITDIPLTSSDDKRALRNAIFRVRDNGGYPDNMTPGANVCLCNWPFESFWMGLDDDKEGISGKETDTPFQTLVIAGVKFRLVQDKAMSTLYGDKRPAAFLLTMKENGKNLINWVHIPDKEMNGKPVLVTQPSICMKAVEVGQIATLDMKDPFKHLFVQSNKDLS